MVSENYELKSGQINFENVSNRGSYSCVVIKNGVFHNLTDQHRKQLIEALQQPSSSHPSDTPTKVKPQRAGDELDRKGEAEDTQTTSIEDMF